MSSYDLSGGIASFAVKNTFTEEMNKLCYKLGQQIKPFCLIADEFQHKHKVIDLTAFGGFDNPNITLLDDIVEERKRALAQNWLGFTEITDELKKTLFFQYLTTVSICYCEVEKWKTVGGEAQPTYDKFLCTRNPNLMSAWVGKSPVEMQASYSRRIQANTQELQDGVLRIVKLNQGSKGNSITVPRTLYNTEKMRCVPLFMLYAFTEGLKTVMQDSIVEFTFLKDNHTERVMQSTLSDTILREFYKDSNFVLQMLGGIDVNSVKQGGMTLSSKAHRGYIKIPELGSSIYDSTGTRSLNIARILEIRKVDKSEVDTSFIDISLSSVVQNFQDSLEYCASKTPDFLPSIYKAFMETDELPDSNATMVGEMESKAVSNESILSTQYQRYLHKFMIGNPQWFPLYTGKPVQSSSTAQNYGVAQLDW